MNDYSQFLSDVEKFKQYEQESANRIITKNNVEIIRFNDDYKYDFITSDSVKYEVKTDIYSKKSNNYYIEYLSNGKASGIRTTEAEFYIINDSVKYYLISTQELKHICTKCKAIVSIFSRTSGFLVPKILFHKHSVEI